MFHFRYEQIFLLVLLTVEIFSLTTREWMKDAFPLRTKSSRLTVRPCNVLIGIVSIDGH